MRSLGNIGFPVPKVFLCECDSQFIGYPFVIMQKEEVFQKSINEMVDYFASTLANLHNLKMTELGISVLRSPENQYGFARRWPIHFKHYLNLETKHDKRLKEDFYRAFNGLIPMFQTTFAHDTVYLMEIIIQVMSVLLRTNDDCFRLGFD